MKEKQIEVFNGTPWEIEEVSAILKNAHIDINVKDQKNMTIFVPFEQYVTASKLLENTNIK